MTDEEQASVRRAHERIAELAGHLEKLSKRVSRHGSSIDAHAGAIEEHHDRLSKLEGRAQIGEPPVYSHTPQQRRDMRKSLQRNFKP